VNKTKKHGFGGWQVRHAWVLAAAGSLPAVDASALGISLGDWVSPVPGHDVLAWHAGYTHSQGTYSGGNPLNSRAGLRASSTLLRYTHPVRVGESVVANPQFGAIAVDIHANSAAGVNDAKGLADPFFTVPFFFTINAQNREYLVIAPFIFFPTGKYDHNDSVNPGANRWLMALQLGYQRKLVGNFNVELMGEANYFTHNDDVGPLRQMLKQDPVFQVNAAISYQIPSDRYSLVGAGLSQRWGGKNTIDGVSANDRQSTTAVFVEASTFFTKQDQILVGISHDFNVRNGFRADQEIKARYIHVF
jgi:hypothetical protein